MRGGSGGHWRSNGLRDRSCPVATGGGRTSNRGTEAPIDSEVWVGKIGADDGEPSGLEEEIVAEGTHRGPRDSGRGPE